MVQIKKQLSLFALTWPIFIEILLHMLMGNADTLMLSQYKDSSVAAVGFTNQLLSVITVMFGFVAAGTSIVVSQFLGANNPLKAKQITFTALNLNLIFGILLSASLFLFGQTILTTLNIPHNLLPQAKSYIKIVGGFIFIQAIIMTIGSSLRSHGYTRDAMYVTLGMNLLNVIGNYIFIFGPFGLPILGVTGVAISTTISRLIGIITMSIIFLMRTQFKPTLTMVFGLNIEHIRSLLRIGIPSAGEQLAYNLSQMVITYFITLLGTEALTTKIYVQNIMMFIFLFSIAIGQGTQILIGHQIGAKQNDQAYSRGVKSLKIATVISVSTAILFYIFSKPILSIFTHDQSVLSTGRHLLLLTILLEPGRAFNLVLINALRATGDVRFPVYMGMISMWFLSIPISYIFGITFHIGLIGIWLGYIVDEWFRGGLMIWRWRSRIWEKKVLLDQTLPSESG